jgi:Ca-activated chloride channel family protein
VNLHGRKTLLSLVLVLGSCLLAQAQVPRPPALDQGNQSNTTPQSDEDKVPTFSVNVKLVNVFVTVLDQNGAPIGGLNKDQFKLKEDGVPQKIAVFSRESELPLSIVVALDVSLSTKRDLKLELDSARKFIHTIVRPQDAVSLYQFSESVDELTKFTSNLVTVDRALDRAHTGAATALYDTIYLGSQALTKRQGRKVLVVITDGGDTVSSVDYQQALRAAQESEAVVYSVIVVPIAADAGRDLGGEHALIQMSHDTGGKHFYAEGAQQLDKAFQQVSDELRTQYLLAYYPSNKLGSSKFRRIEVDLDAEVENGPPIARHRTGYYTAKDSF